jgi:translation initiation factor IF-3
LNEITLSWRINKEIRARELRVIGDDGKQIGVLSLEEALKLSREKGLDLIEIAPRAVPPVAKITDFGKFRYAEEKKFKEQKKKAKIADVKEIRFSPFIAENDYETRINRISEFLSDNHKVRIVIVFKGRQMGSTKFGYELLKKILSNFGDKVVVDMEPKFLGRHLAMIISPLKKVKRTEESTEKDTKNAESKDEENINKEI